MENVNNSSPIPKPIDEDSTSSTNTTMEVFQQFQELYANQLKGTDETCDGLKVSSTVIQKKLFIIAELIPS